MLGDLVNLLGWEAVESLARRLGGRRVYIPVVDGAPRAIVESLGEFRAEQIRRRWAGTRIEVPAPSAVAAARRRSESRKHALTMLAAGQSIRSVAAATGLSARTVRRLKYRGGGAPLKIRRDDR